MCIINLFLFSKGYVSQWTARDVKRKTLGFVVLKIQMHFVPSYLNQVSLPLPLHTQFIFSLIIFFLFKSKSEPIYLNQNIYYSMKAILEISQSFFFKYKVHFFSFYGISI